MRKIDKIILHCAATPEGKHFTVEDIRRWHVLPTSAGGRGWSDIGYHYVICLDGSVHLGRPIERIGAHTIGHNKTSIGICYVGGVSVDGKTPKDTRTPEQKKTLIQLVKDLKKEYPNATIHGHNEFANKACPSFEVKDELNTFE